MLPQKRYTPENPSPLRQSWTFDAPTSDDGSQPSSLSRASALLQEYCQRKQSNQQQNIFGLPFQLADQINDHIGTPQRQHSAFGPNQTPSASNNPQRGPSTASNQIKPFPPLFDVPPYANNSPANDLFAPGTEVHILDSSGNEPSGLATYTVVRPQLNDLTLNPMNGERMYHLSPNPTTRFRACESRLLPVGYKCGHSVEQKTNVVGASVLRRFVVGGERRYDLKDKLGCVWRNVREGELENGWSGGLEGIGEMAYEGNWMQTGEDELNVRMQDENEELGEEVKMEMDWCMT